MKFKSSNDGAPGPRMVEWALRSPKRVFAWVAVLSAVALGLFARIQVDTDPENMLPADQPVRLMHAKAKERFDLRDAIVVGLVAERAGGIYTPSGLANLHRLSHAITQLDGVVAKDVLSLATVDNVEAGGAGEVRFSWMMRTPPKTEAEASAVQRAVQALPMYLGSLVSEDGTAAAIFVPLEDKHQSARIAQDIRNEVAGYPGSERYFVTGLPVAEDTFGTQMFVQMAISAPLAALVIVLMLWLLFRSGALIAAPMLLAMATVIITMGALIGSGFSVHIMSSMIPIFLMPIAVVDSVHVLSEFRDRYPQIRDANETLRRVMTDLFRPMLFTSLTTAAGFASLAFTPIPPVQIFGLFVALGIALAFVFTLTLLPAYVSRLPPRRLESLLRAEREGGDGWLTRGLRAAGGATLRYRWVTLTVSAALAAVSWFGIQQIRINDNPVRWFTEDHPIQVAARTLNAHFSGTYRTYLVLEAPAHQTSRDALNARARGILDRADERAQSAWSAALEAGPSALDGAALSVLARDLLRAQDSLDGGAYDDLDELVQLVERLETEDRTFHSPAVLAALDRLQSRLAASGLVGKTTSVVDVVKTVHRALLSGEESAYRIPETARAVGQVLSQYQSSHRPDDLWHLVTPDAHRAVVWIQHKSGDNLDVSAVTDFVARHLEAHPLPGGIEAEWAGLPYINVVWQREMVRGMTLALGGSFVIVFAMMVALFRSLRYGLLAMIPLALTIGLIYGVLGLVGKDYDMPVAVLSSLALGLSVDFSIHFLERARQLQSRTGSLAGTVRQLFEEPARAISRNALVIAVGFLPLLAAPLVPYVTVGILMAAIMAVSAVTTLVLLPALLPVLPGFWRASTEDRGAAASGPSEIEV